MDDTEVIEITSGESDAEEEEIEVEEEDLRPRKINEKKVTPLRKIFEPIVLRVIDALGGYEGEEYHMGDEASGCLKDLKKLWKKDDTDDERTIARIFWDSRVLMNDLIPIIMVTAGKGMVEDKRAISASDLLTAMTWPIDMAEELKELDDELDKDTDYTQLLESHLHYKAALLKPGVIQALFGIILPPLIKPPKERTERDMQIVNVILHLFRNLAFIKDLPPNVNASLDQAEFTSLQSKLIRALSETNTLELLLTIAANVDRDPLFENVNTLVLEILYLLFRGVRPSSLSDDQQKKPTETLKKLLKEENKAKNNFARFAPSRHSRFGTTISVQLNPKKQFEPAGGGDGDGEDAQPSGGGRPFVVHRQQGINMDLGSIWDMSKRQKAKKGKTSDELTKEDNLSIEARLALQNFATDFIDSCFSPFLSQLLKDIRSERPKITEKDNLRLLFVAKWLLDFFLSTRTLHAERLHSNKSDRAAIEALAKWRFGLVAEVVQQDWMIWVMKRMRGAVEEKPKQWTELQAGTECLTQLLLLVEAMASDEVEEELQEAADVLQHQIIYSGEVLDIACDSLQSYKEGTQSLAYLTSSVNMGYALFKLLERFVKKSTGDMYVRKRSKKKRKKGEEEVPEEEDIPQADEDVVHETMFTLESFEMKFAQSDITHTLLAYLSRYKDFTSPESMKRVVSLLHRQAVRAKAEGLFFKVSTLTLFKTILDDQRSLPRDQPYKDLISLINYVLRKFFRAMQEDTFLAVEAFFPKNRGNWKQYSSYEEPEKPGRKKKATVEDARFPPEVEVKKGYSWSDQLGIAIAALVDDGKEHLVKWLQGLLSRVIGERQRIIEETDGGDVPDDEDEDDEQAAARLAAAKMNGVSANAKAKIQDFLIPYEDDEQGTAGTKNPHMKLLFRLSKFFVLDEDADEWEWYVPKAILPDELQQTYNVIEQFLTTPFDLEGKKASELLSKKRRRRRKPVRAESSDDEAVAGESGNESGRERRKRKKKKEKEAEKYKSAQFIEDSDEEFNNNLDEFMRKEAEKREKTAKIAATLGEGHSGAMRATGTKKRRRKGENGDTKKKRRKRDTPADEGDQDEEEEVVHISSDSDNDARSQGPSSEQPARPRPKPRPIAKRAVEARSSEPLEENSEAEAEERPPLPRPRPKPRPRAKAAQNETQIPTGTNDPESDDLGMAASVPRKPPPRMILSDDDDD